MNYWEAIILAIVEGITEFLPISSTGHMIIVSALMGINENSFVKIYEVNIQFGAILSVVVLYWRKFLQSLDFYFRLIVAFLPAAIIGFALDDYIDSLLGSVPVVAISLLAGGFFLLFVDRIFASSKLEPDPIPYLTGLKIGVFQCIAMIPGVSRSAASIVGGQWLGLSRKAAAEFSFFLAVPTMFGAAAFKLIKDFDQIGSDKLEVIIAGNIVAFLVAMLAIKVFISFLTRYGFKLFGYYRIALGGLILILLAMGYELKL